MKILDGFCSGGRTGFFFDDQRAIKKNAVPNGATYNGTPITKGFKAVRQAGESISVMLLLEDGQIAIGDCCAVQYSGAGGRDPLFLSDEFIPVIEQKILPDLIGKELDSFKCLAEKIDYMLDDATGKRIHTAIRYGVSQAILDAVAKANKKLMAEIIADEYNVELNDLPIPIFTQSGDERYVNVDKMIIKGADVIPHGLINNVDSKLGKKGELLIDYIEWLRKRVIDIRSDESYFPVLHIDVYGTIGIAFNNNLEAITDYLDVLEKAAYPLNLRIEGPIDAEEREAQMKVLRDLTRMIDEAGINVQIVADEWCNTLDDIKYFADNRAGHMIQIKTPDLGGINNVAEAVKYCKEKKVGAYQGGTCNETDISARACVHVAMAVKPDQMLAKPGMGVDEGFMIVYNEMQRIRAIIKAKKEGRLRV